MSDIKEFPFVLSHSVISTPTPNVLLVILNRPKAFNCLTRDAQYELERVFVWFDKEPALRCAVITGAGTAFSTGGDLREWNSLNQSQEGTFDLIPRRGFSGLTRRFGKKPIIAAVNGAALGGGFELLWGTDIIISSRQAHFGLPEVKRGVVAVAGCLPRLVKSIGRQRAMELTLLGRPITAECAHNWGIVNELVDDELNDGDILRRPVVLKALQYAKEISQNSPESVVASRAGVLLGLETGTETASWLLKDFFDQGIDTNENLHEGILAFTEKRIPSWKPSKL
ncbi:ClpP/crotonase-like domain-containing protein [Aspergillus ambiguus]|uniref:ClpP/crotonase-like domain-containing protein n=1 Tax=Aspergillus ambiguus TaxID=176160 RepID=UPI003CCD1407